MKLAHRVIMIILMMLFLGTGVVMAVGYDRYEEPATTQVNRTDKPTACEGATKVSNGMSWLERYPMMIDQVASFVKDLLGQFGIVETKAP
jgi:hypothetical protein